MFEPFFMHDMEPKKQYLCCLKLVYMPGLTLENQEKMPLFDIYVRCYMAKVDEHCYMVTFCEKPLCFSDKFYVRIFNERNLPPVYKMPLLWALTGNIITFTDDGRVDFLRNGCNKAMRVTDIFDKNDCISRETYVKMCLESGCCAE